MTEKPRFRIEAFTLSWVRAVPLNGPAIKIWNADFKRGRSLYKNGQLIGIAATVGYLIQSGHSYRLLTLDKG